MYMGHVYIILFYNSVVRACVLGHYEMLAKMKYYFRAYNFILEYNTDAMVSYKSTLLFHYISSRSL